MSHFCTHLYVHLIFATKHRAPFIEEPVRAELESYISKLYTRNKHALLAHFAMPDHYHGLFRLHPMESLSDVVRRIKTASSYWLNKAHFSGGFAWQIGYGAFGHLAGDLDPVIAYIRNQHTHHATRTLQHEVDQLNRKYGTDWQLD